MTQVICEREFKTERDGVLVPVRASWGLPEEAPGGEWRCAIEISIGGVLHRKASVPGVDSVQALLLALASVGGDLHSYDPPVFWFAPDDDLGLPVPDVVADHKEARSGRGASHNG